MTDKTDVSELVEQTQERYEESQERQSEFLDAVQDESETDLIETECNLVGDIVTPVSAKYDGELIDRFGELEDRLTQIDNGNGGLSDVSTVADEISQFLADVVDDPDLNKDAFYKAYRSEGLSPLGEMLETAFEAIKTEAERKQGAADGFR